MQYVSTNLVTVTFKIDSKGNSSSQVDVRINPSYSSVDTEKATVKIIDKKTGSIVRTWNDAVCSLYNAKIGSVISAAGGTIYIIGDAQVTSLSTVKAGTDHVVEMDFKWTHTKSYPLKGTFRITTYFMYNGKVVGDKRVTYQNREFALGERWDFEEELEIM